MKLYTNGCSWVWGDELKDRENEAFPFLLQKKLNCQLIDDSECGSDNQRILRTTLKADLPIQSDCFVIIGWASIIRYEYYDRDSTTWVSNICSAFTEEYPPIHKYFEYDWFVINFLNQVLALQNYLKYNNIPFFFFESYPMYKEKDMDYLEHFDLIDKDTFPSLFNPDLIFMNYCKNNGLNNFMPKLHPTKEQHKLWSEYLYEKIRVLE
jgi:hypothetical protein